MPDTPADHRVGRVGPEIAIARARVAGLIRREASPERIAAARAELESAKINTAIDRLIAQAPPLTAEQRARLAALLDSAP